MMPKTNGPKRTIHYARVSTDEQAKRAYSLAQQLEVLRAYCEREGYEVLGEVQDAGQSGASLERPGMDRVRDPVAAGGVSVMVPLGSGRLVRNAPPRSELEPLHVFGVETWAQAPLMFVFSEERVSCAIPATSSQERMHENARAGEPPWFGEEERGYVADLARR